MKKQLKHKILQLKSNSFKEIDHLSILQEIYDEFNKGEQEYYLLARFFINGLDDIPNLKQRQLWNEAAFEKARKIFYNSQGKLIQIIDTYYDLENDEKLQQQFHHNKNLKSIWIEKNGKKHGIFKRYYDDTKLAYISEYDNGQSTGSVKEWYPNGQITEEGKYLNNEYVVEQFWGENGNQLLKDGNGKTIRKYGTNDYDIYEQYFENYEFKGEKKIQGVTFGKFEEKKNET
jgi:antitoxin component YwqK of YwqJK toxin-antitoxin module